MLNVIMEDGQGGLFDVVVIAKMNSPDAGPLAVGFSFTNDGQDAARM